MSAERLRHSSLRWCLAVVCAAAVVCGCAAGPDYARPRLNLPTRYVAEPLQGESAPGKVTAADAQVAPQHLSTQLDVEAQWWRAFGSASLNALVSASLANNPNVQAAQAALRAAHENVGAERAAFAPNAALGFSPSRQRIPGALASPASSGATYYDLYTAQLSVSYAPDVFGGIRRQVEVAQAQEELERFQLEATYLTLSSNVVVAAVTEGALRAERAATQSIIAEQRNVLERYRRQLELGQTAAADVDAQEAALAIAEAGLPPLDKLLAQQRNLIKTLAGRYPSDEISARFELDSIELPVELPLVLPAALVEHRPDVRSAEAQLQAASAGIGVAVAARLPSVLLGVNAYGSSAYSLSQLFTPSSVFWTLTAGVTQPLFDGGALKHRENAAREAFLQAQAQYRATVQSAFQDVANSLVAIDADTRAARAARDAQQAASKSLERTRRQVELGDASPLALLLAQQAAQQALLGLVQARANRLTDAAALFQSLGGGWWNRADGQSPAIESSSAR